MQIYKKQFLVARDMILNCPIEIFDRIEHVEWFSFVSLKYDYYLFILHWIIIKVVQIIFSYLACDHQEIVVFVCMPYLCLWLLLL